MKATLPSNPGAPGLVVPLTDAPVPLPSSRGYRKRGIAQRALIRDVYEVPSHHRSGTISFGSAYQPGLRGVPVDGVVVATGLTGAACGRVGRVDWESLADGCQPALRGLSRLAARAPALSGSLESIRVTGGPDSTPIRRVPSTFRRDLHRFAVQPARRPSPRPRRTPHPATTWPDRRLPRGGGPRGRGGVPAILDPICISGGPSSLPCCWPASGCFCPGDVSRSRFCVDTVRGMEWDRRLSIHSPQEAP